MHSCSVVHRRWQLSERCVSPSRRLREEVKDHGAQVKLAASVTGPDL
ncbi:hypothetical protein J2R88_003557 [Bradyrhizobium japonicum]|nr:hypothetical protein [Bradyrhizobium japonicum]MCP1793782.1 hypothetical protein [Bradyrhizobium japonicum]MCP1806215.1 hypothetical protein [Bradyrhizobium japonicum]MCP1815143.1 hypothetical protein [Bradyrhizobium japonicum]MCS3911735.1 hypothetical protein [Bradyrhizobium japonicum]